MKENVFQEVSEFICDFRRWPGVITVGDSVSGFSFLFKRLAIQVGSTFSVPLTLRRIGGVRKFHRIVV